MSHRDTPAVRPLQRDARRQVLVVGGASLLLAVAAGKALLARPAHATVGTVPPAEVGAELPGARLQGDGRLRWLGLLVYDARLWAREPVSATGWATAPLALELQYARSLPGKALAERSLEEMRRQQAIDDDDARRWLDELGRIFPDVREGDRITGVKRPGEAARFFVNGSLRGEVRDAEFTRLFFGIWLAEQSSQPALRSALLRLPR